jgi:hypothetical protein
MMKKIAALMAALSLACSAQAEVLTFSYTAKIDYILLYVGSSIAQPSTSTVRDRTVSNGDIVTGYFSIDTSTRLIGQYTSQNELWQTYQDSSSANALTSKIGDAGPVTGSTSPRTAQSISATHAPTGGLDRLTVNSDVYQDGNYFEGASINFVERSTGPGNGIDTSLIALTQNSHYIYTFADYTASSYTAMSAVGYLTSLTFISSEPSGPTGPSAPVPEADTYSMLLAGLGVLGWASRRQRRSREVF